MGDFSLTIAIEQQPAVAFAFIAEPTNMTCWYDAVDHVTITAGEPIGRGTRFETVRSLPAGRAINEVEITDYEPNRRITFESRQGPTPFRYRYTLEPTGSHTVVTLQRRRADRCPGGARRRRSVAWFGSAVGTKLCAKRASYAHVRGAD